MKYLIWFLATRRLTSLAIEDEIFREQREAIWRKYPPTTKIGFLFTCPKCMSVWAGFAVLISSRQSLGRLVLNTLALSEASIVTDELLKAAKPDSLMN